MSKSQKTIEMAAAVEMVEPSEKASDGAMEGIV